MGLSLRRLLTTLAALAIAPALASAQQDATITGRVVDRATQQPLPDVQILVVGTTLGTRSGDGGRYRIGGVPAGQVQLRVIRIGYESATRTLAVGPGETVTADFALAAAAITLDRVVVTATGEQQRTRESGNSVAVIDVEQVNLAPVQSFSDLLSSRAAGVVVQTSGGTTGGSSRIRIRGSNSVSLTNDPLLIIDGVRVNNSAVSNSIGVGGQSPSRFDDINPEDIENIEVLKGPAASALYGTAAANGVIQITTKKGRQGAPRWNLYTEAGDIREIIDYPANYVRRGTTINRATAAQNGLATVCTLEAEARQLCVPNADGLASWNPLEDPTATPFRDGWRTGLGLSVSGGGEQTTYYVAGDLEREQGVYDVNKLRRVNLRSNLRTQVRDNINLTISGGYLDSDLELPQNDNNLFGFISGGLLGRATDDEAGRGYAAGFPPSLFMEAVSVQQDVNRFTGGANLNWQITPWLNAVGVAGIDLVSRNDHSTTFPNIIFSFGLNEGSRTNNRFAIATYTANGGLTATYGLTPDIQSTSSVGMQYTEEETRSTRAFGAVLLPGTGSLEGTSSRFAVGENNVENVTVGIYGQQQFAWKDRLFVTGALRADDNSAFGQDFGLVYYPSASLSYVISEEPFFFPDTRWLSLVRLRLAYGESGQRPSFRDAVTFFNPVAVTVRNVSVAAIAVGGTGNPTLEPERSREFEAGFEAGLLEGRLGLDFTWFTRQTRNALVARRLAPSLGASTTRFENLGRVDNRGWELQLTSNIVQQENFGWELGIAASGVKNKLVELGEGITPIIFGLGGASQRHQEGFPLGAYFMRPIISWADLNGDGVITRAGCPGAPVIGPGGVPVAQQPPCEITIGDTAVFLGSPFPEREISINSSLTLFRWARLHALLDYRGGYELYNSTTSFRCASVFQNCQAAFDPTAPLEEQARAQAVLLGTEAGYIEDADFWKLREVSLTLTAPTEWARRLRTEGMRLTIAGRNLGTWTDYTGFDPEVNSTGSLNFNAADFLTQPNVRTFTARLDFTF